MMNDEVSGRETALSRMRDALAHLAQAEVVGGGGFERAVQAVVETSAGALDVRRVGYWVLETEPTRLRLVDQYDAVAATHSSGAVFLESEFPPYFDALRGGRALLLDDARSDTWTTAFAESYLAPAGITSRLDIPVLAAGSVAGVVSHERLGPARAFTPEEQQFAATVAALLAMGLEIREHRAAEAELGRTRNALQNLVAMLPMALVGLDAAERVVSWNRAAEVLFGWSAAEVLGGPLTTVPATELGAHQASLAAARSGQRVAFQAPRRRRDGTLVEVGAWAGPDGAGGAMALFADLTQHREAERALAASEARWRSLVSNAPASIVQIDREGTITFVNRTMGGHAVDQLLGRSLYTFVEEPLRVRQVVASVFDTAGPETYDTSIRSPDGAPRWFTTIAGPVLDGAGAVESVVLVSTETTHVVDALRAIERERDRARAYLDVVGVTILALDAGGRVTLINRCGCELLGRTEREVIGTSWVDVFVVPEARASVRAALDCMLGGGATENLEYEVLGAAEARRLYFRHAALTQDGGITELLVSGDDVTDDRRARTELAEYRDHLEAVVEARTAEIGAVNKELEAFAYSVSHDLRAPLRSIDGFGEALLEDYGPSLDDTARDWLGRIRSASSRMNQLIDGLLVLSRATRGQLADETVDLGALSSSIAAELRRTAPDREVEFVIADGLVTRGDPALLRTVLENLLGNAWKFTSRKPRARIEVGVTDRGGQRAWFVRDDGAGFDPAHADRLFTVFQRLHTTAEFEGSGIGLATVQRIVHRHGGRVGAEGEIGSGATFWFTLGDRQP